MFTVLRRRRLCRENSRPGFKIKSRAKSKSQFRLRRFVFAADSWLQLHHVAGLTDYDYTDPVTLTQTKVADTKMKTTLSGPFLGLRWTLFKSLLLHPFIEGGVELGSIQAAFPDAETDHPLSTAKFKESQTYTGSYYQAGLELTLFNLALGAEARFSKFNTAKFRSLDDQKLGFGGTTIFTTVGVRY